jgi:hypothetical protein
LFDLVSPQQQTDDIRATKKPRLETPIATAAAEDAEKTAASPDVALALPRPAAHVDDDAKNDYVMDTQSNPRAAGVTGRWTPEEDGELTSAVANAKKNKWGSSKRDWVEIAPKPK